MPPRPGTGSRRLSSLNEVWLSGPKRSDAERSEILEVHFVSFYPADTSVSRLRGFEHHRVVGESRVGQHVPESVQSHVSGPDVGVAVDPTAARGFGVI